MKKLTVDEDRLESMEHNNGTINGEIVSLNSGQQSKKSKKRKVYDSWMFIVEALDQIWPLELHADFLAS